MSKSLFVDSDIFIDVYSKRSSFYEDSSKLLSLAESKRFDAYTSPLVIANIYFVLQRFGGKEVAMNAIRKTRTFIGIVEMNQDVVDRAIHSGFYDFEDALEAYSAENAMMDMIVTRNIKDFKRSKISILSPSEATALF